ncbi:MAG: hypothetical protein AAF928_20115 [Myxococcota bacterium]
MGPSLLISFDDDAQLARAVTEQLMRGHVTCPGAVAVGTRCELVLVHPSSGETLVLRGEAVQVGADGTQFRFGATPLVKNQLRRFAGDVTGEASVNQRIRKLNVVDRRKLALQGDQTERVALERIFGKAVWEALLQNPRITVPEVARIARMGTIPRPLLEVIVGHGGWVKVPQVRRALLSNPRLESGLVMRVLRHLPKAELELVPRQTAYPMAVRSAAKRWLNTRKGRA